MATAEASATAEMAEKGAASEALQAASATPLMGLPGRTASYNSFVALMTPVLTEVAVLRFPQSSLNVYMRIKPVLYDKIIKSRQIYLFSIPHAHNSD